MNSFDIKITNRFLMCELSVTALKMEPLILSFHNDKIALHQP